MSTASSTRAQSKWLIRLYITKLDLGRSFKSLILSGTYCSRALYFTTASTASGRNKLADYAKTIDGTVEKDEQDAKEAKLAFYASFPSMHPFTLSILLRIIPPMLCWWLYGVTHVSDCGQSEKTKLIYIV